MKQTPITTLTRAMKVLNKLTIGPQRFAELRRSIGDITPKILTARLRFLEEYNLLHRHVDSTTIPIKVYYKLTKRGYIVKAKLRRIETYLAKK